jgi:transketolase
LRHNPGNPAWPGRDRFVLSNGHGSMLIYALLHLTGYALPIEELKRFRQLGSKTAGHPERGHTPGVETTTGPLGQGIANAVGMALAEKLLAAQFNRSDFDLVDHHTYVFMGDGCMMEGISHEACSLAGTLGLGKLIAFYDDNGISIDSEKGELKNWFTDDVPKRFAAYGWQVIPAVDGHDVEAVDKAIRKAKREKERPTLICCKTIIAKGAPKKANTGAAHGAPLGAEEIAATRQAIGWPYPPFEIPDAVRARWDARDAGKRAEKKWNALFKKYSAQFPAEAAEFLRRSSGRLPEGFEGKLKTLVEETNQKAETIATRKASQNVLEVLVPAMPELLGGSADLAGSNLTMVKASKPLLRGSSSGNNIFYGVREFGMCAAMNGISLHGGFIPYGGTFLVFSDYARNALRMAALMKIRVVYVFTHDSIGLGEDGPTHQPIEHASSLRLIPNMELWRPCDSVETAVAWGAALERADGPTALLLSRQNLPFCKREALADVGKGG